MKDHFKIKKNYKEKSTNKNSKQSQNKVSLSSSMDTNIIASMRLGRHTIASLADHSFNRCLLKLCSISGTVLGLENSKVPF